MCILMSVLYCLDYSSIVVVTFGIRICVYQVRSSLKIGLAMGPLNFIHILESACQILQRSQLDFW
jgi:hypothetical protein